MTGETRCASSGVVDLRDTEATVNFNLNQSRCLTAYGSANRSFSEGGGQYPNGDFHKVQPVLCINGSLNSSTCAPALNATIYKSYRAIFSADKKGTISNALSELTSACQVVGSSPVLALPLGDNSGASQLGFRFVFYPSTTCSGVSVTENFNTSLKHGTTGSTLRALENNSGLVTTYLFINPGAVAAASSIQINAGNLYTNVTSVSVSFSTLAPDVAELCFSEMSTGADCTGPSWITLLSSPRAVTLSATEGTKNIYVFSKTSASVISLLGQDSIILDSSAPLSSGPGNFQPAYNTLPVVLSWPAYTDATAINYNLSFCDSSSCSSGCSSIGSTTSTDVTISSSADGTYNVCLIATDAAGNSSPATDLGVFEYDTVAPVISNLQLNSNAPMTNSLNLNFNNTVTGGPDKMCFNSSSSAMGCSWINYAATGVYTLTPGEGLRNVYLHVKDSAGNMSFTNVSIDVDTMTPTLPGMASVNAFYNGSELPFTFNWGASTDANLLRYDIKVCGSIDCSTNCGSERPTPGVTPSDSILLSDGVIQGENHICLRAVDLIGNQSGYSQVASFNYDSIAPVLGGVNFILAAGKTHTKNTSINWTRTGSIDATQMCVSVANTPNTCAPWIPITSSGNLVLPATNGVHTVYTYYKDAASNYSPEQLNNIILDTIPPVAMNFLLPANPIETESASVPFSFTGGTDLNFDKVVARLCNDSGCGVTYDTIELAIGVTSGTLTASNWAMGTNAVIVLKAYDLAENYSAVTVSPMITRAYNLKPKEMSLGYFHSCFAFSDGRAKCFGQNTYGQLGTGSMAAIPGTVPGSMGNALPFIDFSMAKVKSIVAGGYSTCAILSDGQLKCWGANDRGQLGLENTATLMAPGASVNVGTSPAIQVAVSETHTCIVNADGDVKCWGNNSYGQLGQGNTTNAGDAPGTMGANLVPVNLLGKKAIKVSVGDEFSCALLSDRTVKCWGFNLTGQLGLDHTISKGGGASDMSSLPVLNLGAGEGVVDISSAQSHSCALLANGVVKCWGSNIKGQLGTKTNVDHGAGGGSMAWLAGVDFGGGKKAIKITTGSNTSCAVLEDGTSKCWGENTNGIVGQGNVNISFNDPSVISLDLGTGQTVRSIATNSNNACAILGNGNVKCWGSASGHGQGVPSAIGVNPGQMGDSLPFVKLGTTNILDPMKIASGSGHNCALMYNGLVKCWGDNGYGQLGSNTLGGFKGSMPSDMGANLPFVELGVNSSKFVRDISSGGYNSKYTCAQMMNGEMKCWGSNSAGQLGVVNSGASDIIGDDAGEVSASLAAISFQSSKKVRSMSTGGNTTCAVMGDGSAYCFGENSVGQCGAESSSSILGPTSPVVLSEKVIQITTGQGHTCALLATGDVKCWGDGSSGQLGNSLTNSFGYSPSSMLGVTAVDMGLSHKAIKIDAGKSSTCALLDNRTVKCWGNNTAGVLGLDTNLNVGHAPSVSSVAQTPAVNFMENAMLNVAVDVETNGETTCVLRANGLVRCWGDNTYGMLGQNSSTVNMGTAGYPTIAGNIVDTVLSGFAPVEKLTVGMNGCVISTHGGAMCWGSNYMGKAGQGTGVSEYGTAGSPVSPTPINL